MEGWEPRPSHRWDVVDGPVYTRVESCTTPPTIVMALDDLRAVLVGVTDEFDRVVIPDAGHSQPSVIAFGPDSRGALVARVSDGTVAGDMSFVWWPSLSDEAHAELIDVVVALGGRWPLLFSPDGFQCPASDREKVEEYIAAWRAGEV